MLLICIILSVLIVSGCTQPTSSPYICENRESVVSSVILENIETSDYIDSLAESGLELTRFRGPADSCFQIPENYVHLKNGKIVSALEWYVGGVSGYVDRCNDGTLKCN